MTVINYLKSVVLKLGSVFVIMALLAAISVMAVVGQSVTGTDAYSVLMAVTVGTAVAGGIVLQAPVPNSQLLPHLLLILSVIGMVVALNLEHVFISTQVVGVFSGIVGGGAVGSGAAILTKT